MIKGLDSAWRRYRRISSVYTKTRFQGKDGATGAQGQEKRQCKQIYKKEKKRHFFLLEVWSRFSSYGVSILRDFSKPNRHIIGNLLLLPCLSKGNGLEYFVHISLQNVTLNYGSLLPSPVTLDC